VRGQICSRFFCAPRISGALYDKIAAIFEGRKMGSREFTRMVWRQGMTFDATTTTGHHLVIDALPPAGNDNGPKPIELVLTALAGCTAMDVLSILQKKREPIEGLEVFVEGVRQAEHPRIYTDIQVVYRVRGNVAPTALARAIELSETKYCGVSAMLKSSAHITTRYEIETAPVPVSGKTFDGNGHGGESEQLADSLP
jgi:putative redox protein